MAREMINCPNHEGAYDCTPFCRICEGNQGYYPMFELPERINVMKVVSYDVQKIVEEMCNPENGWVNGLTNTIPEPHEITTEMILEYIEGWIEQDFPADRIKDLIIQDENGEEL